MAEREGRYGRRGLLAVSAIATGFLAEAVNLVPVPLSAAKKPR
jgi:hypothetical protein